jgi:hypothetical protein
MYDPLAKWIIRESLTLIIVFMFIETAILPLSVINVFELILMTLIVANIVYHKTKLETLKSLHLTLQILNVFTIIYIFIKYILAFADYTNNIDLKNIIENGDD